MSRVAAMGWGERIKRAREDAGLSQRALGEIVGAAQSTVDGWEHESSEPSLEKFSAIGAATGRSAVWLAFGDQGSAPQAGFDPELMKKIVAAVERRVSRKILMKPTPEGRATMIVAVYDLVRASHNGDVDARIERHLDALT